MKINPDLAPPTDISIILPCLNEAESLPHCLPNAIEAIQMARAAGFSAELLLADNGSTDGSQNIAQDHGARVIHVSQRGYGAALIGGLSAAKGRYLVMGDADGSYNFKESLAMVKCLSEGADLCMGSRFLGEIKPGAMPWKNRHIGNPILTSILNLFFKPGISDAHCGLRALTKNCFHDLKLTSIGMEFASEMVVKASLLEKKIAEVPITLSPDKRSRPPHLRPWRDGWRHLIFLLLLSPIWLFLSPGILSTLLGISILIMSMLAIVLPDIVTHYFGNTWAIVAGGLIILGQQGCIFALASHVYGVQHGYRRKSVSKILAKLTLESLLIAGLICIAVGIALLGTITAYWGLIHFQKIEMVAPQVIGITLLVIGVQNIFGGFLLATIGGNKSSFMEP